jgi:hypothetical protein
MYVYPLTGYMLFRVTSCVERRRYLGHMLISWCVRIGKDVGWGLLYTYAKYI